MLKSMVQCYLESSRPQPAPDVDSGAHQHQTIWIFVTGVQQNPPGGLVNPSPQNMAELTALQPLR